MSTENEDLTGLHASFQSHLSTLVASGVDQTEAIEAMLTVGIANKLKADGPRATAEALRLVSQFLAVEAGHQNTGKYFTKTKKH